MFVLRLQKAIDDCRNNFDDIYTNRIYSSNKDLIFLSNVNPREDKLLVYIFFSVIVWLICVVTDAKCVDVKLNSCVCWYVRGFSLIKVVVDKHISELHYKLSHAFQPRRARESETNWLFRKSRYILIINILFHSLYVIKRSRIKLCFISHISALFFRYKQNYLLEQAYSLYFVQNKIEHVQMPFC